MGEDDDAASFIEILRSQGVSRPARDEFGGMGEALRRGKGRARVEDDGAEAEHVGVSYQGRGDVHRADDEESRLRRLHVNEDFDRPGGALQRDSLGLQGCQARRCPSLHGRGECSIVQRAGRLTTCLDADLGANGRAGQYGCQRDQPPEPHGLLELSLSRCPRHFCTLR